MNRCFRVSLGLAVSVSVAVSNLAWGDEYHYVNTLLGERASTMGGAYVAVSDDPSGLYYNPAGMVFGFENYVSGSANTYTRTETKFQNIVAGRDYSLRSAGLVPSFLGVSQNFKKSKVAFGIMVPNSTLQNQDDVLTDLSTANGSVSSLRRRFFQEDTTYLLGSGFSTAIGEKASIGISVLASVRVGTILDNQFIQFNPKGAGQYFVQENQINYNVYGLVPKFGAQFMPTPKWALGATVSKGFRFTGNGSSRLIHTQVDNAGKPVVQNGQFDHDFAIQERSISVTPAQPWVVSGGIAYFPSKSLLFSGDYSFYSADNQSSNFKAVSTYNVAVGAEWFVLESLALRIGIFTDNANTAKVSTQATNQAPHVDLLGSSAGITFVRSGSSFTLGVQYARGTGLGQAVGDTTATQPIEQSQLSLHIAGSYQL
jgi:long-chain fatty acid transport protein